MLGFVVAGLLFLAGTVVYLEYLERRSTKVAPRNDELRVEAYSEDEIEFIDKVLKNKEGAE